MPNDNHQFTATDVLYRIVLPLGSAVWAATQFPGSAIGNWFLVAVLMAGIYFAAQGGLEAIDRRLNVETYERGVP